MIVLETARLRIRGLEFSDLEPFFAVCSLVLFTATPHQTKTKLKQPFITIKPRKE
jgi:hypothetical protein